MRHTAKAVRRRRCRAGAPRRHLRKTDSELRARAGQVTDRATGPRQHFAARRAITAGHVLPFANTDAMNAPLAAIARTMAPIVGE